MSAVLDIEILDDERIVEQVDDLSMRERVEIIALELAQFPQVDCPVVSRFAPGVYLREIHMPADTIVIGKVHRTEHFNVLVRGACLIVHDDGSREELRAPMTFVSKAGVQKVLYITEDMIWQTVHPTVETDIVKLEAELIEPSPAVLSALAQAECARIGEERS
jgi:hypothetical protein